MWTISFVKDRDPPGWRYWDYSAHRTARSWRTGVAASPWRVDPDHPVDPSAMTLRLLVREEGCASGLSATGRVQPLDIAADAAEVTLTVYVTPLPGSQECPMNPETPVIVDLPQALGDRALRDGATYRRAGG
ncbi:MAG TPA: hypothetical protein VIJ51_07810 [Solirubrobacteraceae bacterium]